MPILVERTGKNHLKQGQESMGGAPMLSHCSLLKNPSSIPTGVLDHCREGETNSWSFIFRGVSLSTHP